MTDQVIRIGRPPQAPRPERKKTGYWVVAASVLIAMSGLVVAVYFFSPPTSPTAEVVPSAAVDNRLECVSVEREYESWQHGKEKLVGLFGVSAAIAGYDVKRLVTDADAFAKATRGYDDSAAKALAVLIATYRVEVGLLGLELAAAGTLSRDQYSKVLDAWVATENGYRAFRTSTCR